MKKLLSILLAILCVMNLTVVSFAAEEDATFFDESTGTLHLYDDYDFYALFNENELELLFGIEVPAWYAENYDKVRTINVGKDFYSINEKELLTVAYLFPNIEEMVVDEEHPLYTVYDKGLYTKDGKELLYYPLQSDDVDIVLHENTQYIYNACFLDLFKTQFFGMYYIPATDKEYNLYITRQGQLQEMINLFVNTNTNGNFESLYYTRYANIYANEDQETLDNLSLSKETGWPYTIKGLYDYANTFAFELYYNFRGYFVPDLYPEKLTEYKDAISSSMDGLEINEEQTFEEKCEITETYYRRLVEAFWANGFEEYTRENFERNLAVGCEYEVAFVTGYGSTDEAYEAYAALINSYEKHILYLYNRGNPVKPLSTLTSGTCGDGAEWAIDRENGVLSITGNGTISDNYSGFDVFKDIITTVEIGNGITAIGENVFTGFGALTETKYDGTQSQWNAVTVEDGNEDLLKNVTVNPDPPVTPEQPEEELTLWDKIVEFFNEVSNFFIKIFDWFKNLLGF